MEKSTLSEDIKTEKRTSNMSYKESVMPTRKDMVYAISGGKLGKFLSVWAEKTAMRECPESREKRPLKMAALYKRLTFELIFNLAITRSFLRATFNVIHMVPVIRILRFG